MNKNITNKNKLLLVLLLTLVMVVSINFISALALIPYVPPISYNYDSLPGGTTTVEFAYNEYVKYITLVNFDVTTDVSSDDVRFLFKQLNATTTAEPKGTIYRYFSIDAINLPSGRLSTARLRIKVDKAWLAENNFDKNKIVLFRYTDNWEAVSTKTYKEDDSYVYYQGYTVGLGLFAVVANETKVSQSIPDQPAPQDTQSQQQNSNVSSENNAQNGSPKNNTTLWIVLGVSLIVVVILGIILFNVLKKEKHAKPEHHERPEKHNHEK